MGFIEEFSLQFRPFLDIKNLKTFRVCHVQTLSYLLPSGSFSLTFEFLFLTLIERRRRKNYCISFLTSLQQQQILWFLSIHIFSIYGG